MKLTTYTLLGILLTLCNLQFTNGQTVTKNTNGLKASFISLDGSTLVKGNAIEADGNVHLCSTPLLRLLRTKTKEAKGTVLLLPGGGYEMLAVTEGRNAAAFLNGEGFDVAMLDYSIALGQQARDQALEESIMALRLLKTNHAAFGLRGNRLDIVGIASGGHLAARMMQHLGETEQPDNVLLLSPAYLDETLFGTVTPAIMPPLKPIARLFTAIAPNAPKALATSSSEYTKTWVGYDGLATASMLPDSNLLSDKNKAIVTAFLFSAAAAKDTTFNPAALPVAGYSPKRHEEKLALVAKEKFDLIMVGNSITNNFEKPEYQPIWNQFFAPRHALNLGFSGYRTENIIWNLQHGELEGQSPKVAVLEIGTNNIDEKNYPTRHTAGQLAGGIKAIVALMREKLPNTKIIILRCFPGCYGGPNPTSHRAILERASEIVSTLADGKNIFYCDVNHVFLNLDGSINHAMMPDWLHPSPAGAKAWAQAMEPLMSQLMGDSSLDTDIPANTAIVPITKLEEDSYNWWDRHAEVLRIKDSINPEIVLIGNSITHFWGGLPQLRNANGQLRQPNGPSAWVGLFGKYRVLNLGFGWDRTQNALWRLDHGEIDGLHPRAVIIDIGTNNTSQTDHARMNTASEIVEGIRAVCLRVRSKLPHTKIILMAIFPREENPLSTRRVLINDINTKLKAFAVEQQITLVDIGPRMLTPDGHFLPGMMLDYTHPTDKGYQVWADGIRDLIAAL